MDPHIFLSPGAREAIQEAALMRMTPIPEPSTLIVFALGVFVLFLLLRFR